MCELYKYLNAININNASNTSVLHDNTNIRYRKAIKICIPDIYEVHALINVITTLIKIPNTDRFELFHENVWRLPCKLVYIN